MVKTSSGCENRCRPPVTGVICDRTADSCSQRRSSGKDRFTLRKGFLVFRTALGLVALVSLTAAGCGASPRPNTPPPSSESRKDATVIEYVDAEAFDLLLEAALNRQDAVIVVQTESTRPDWEGRLNAWIAAWNEGGKVQKGDGLFLKKVDVQS